MGILIILIVLLVLAALAAVAAMVFFFHRARGLRKQDDSQLDNAENNWSAADVTPFEDAATGKIVQSSSKKAIPTFYGADENNPDMSFGRRFGKDTE
mmetsp:Transcript_85428/g.178472  ORF Transcript_85428/g.178472 Transcript_85428/m.178472 type:complete len:97 (+) Transcript_85428:92-382(+)